MTVPELRRRTAFHPKSRASSLVAVLAIAMFAAGCSADTPQGSSRKASEPTEPSGPTYSELTKAQAKKTLLKLSDLPTGFSIDRSSEPESDVTFKSGDPACKDYVDGAYGGGKPKVDVSADFIKDAFGPFVGSGVVVREEHDAKSKMDMVIASLESCEHFVDGSDNSKMSVSPVSFPKLGEQSVAVRLVIETPDVEITGTFVGARIGGNIVSVADAGVTGGIGAEQLERLARTAVSRVESAARK